MVLTPLKQPSRRTLNQFSDNDSNKKVVENKLGEYFIPPPVVIAQKEFVP